MKSSLNVLHPAHTCLAFAMALACPPALAQDSDRLVELINQYRKSPQRCSGAMLPAASALSPDRNLARVNVSQGGELQKALKDAGYQAARAEAIVLTGVQTPDVAMKAITEAYCRSVMKQQYSAIGVSRHGNTWRIVFARPLLSSDMRDPLSSGKQVLALVNTARGKPRMCGDRRFSAAPPLEWNDTLAKAALVHSRDMADRNYFRHEATDGSQVGDRAQRAGYRWQSVGENIAAGQGSAQQVVEGWLSSPGHCANIMNRGFTEMGAAYALNQNSDASIYWTQVFGRPR
ncbi:MAG TPA: CAP domain-containing protein [Noviherbaspirillum sp.]|nr:CAP domain-containing protein [Noviherbaspirillum sp.]